MPLLNWGWASMVKRFVDYTPHGIIYLLKNKKKLQIEAYVKGVPSTIEFLVDLDAVMEEANFTDRQREIIELHYINDLTQEEVAEHFGISQQAVLCSLKAIKGKIHHVLCHWEESSCFK